MTSGQLKRKWGQRSLKVAMYTELSSFRLLEVFDLLETSSVSSSYAFLPCPRYYGVGYGLHLCGSQDESVNLYVPLLELVDRRNG